MTKSQLKTSAFLPEGENKFPGGEENKKREGRKEKEKKRIQGEGNREGEKESLLSKERGKRGGVHYFYPFLGGNEHRMKKSRTIELHKQRFIRELCIYIEILY